MRISSLLSQFFAGICFFLPSAVISAEKCSECHGGVTCMDFGSSSFVGLGLGYGSGYFRSQGTSPFDGSNVLNQPASTTVDYDFLARLSSSKSSMSGFVGDLQLGWNCRFRNSHVVFGVIAGGAIASNSGTLAYPRTSISKNSSSQVQTVFPQVAYIKTKDKGWFDAGFRFGVAVGRSLLYIKLAWAIHDINAKFSYSTDQSRSLTKWVNCLLTGIGTDFHITRQILFGVSADIHLGRKTSFSFREKAEWIGTVTSRPILLVLLASIKYSFPVE